MPNCSTETGPTSVVNMFLYSKKKKVPLHWGKRHMTVLTISRCVVQQCEMCVHFCVTSRTFSFLKKLELSTHVRIFIFKLLSNF